MINLINKVFNGKDYTLVDEYDDIIENNILYYFVSEDDDLFAVKVNDEYVIITDEQIIKLTKNKYGLFPPEVIFYKEREMWFGLFKILNGKITIDRKLNDEEREAFFDTQVKKLKELGDIIDFGKLKDILMADGAVYIGTMPDVGGAYHCSSKTILVPESKSFGNYTNLHETIHKATAANIVEHIFTIMPSILIEGGAESICEKLRGNKESSIKLLVTKMDGSCKVRYNFDLNSDYHGELALLRQIEHAVGYTADVDVLSGSRNILDDFSQRYGKDVLRYVKHVGNQFTRRPNHGKGLCEKMIKAQNLILERVFNKDFPENPTLESAHEYMKKLEEMRQHRGEISGDYFYKEFYEDKYRVLKEKLLEKGYEISQIEEKIPKYMPMEFYPTREENKVRKKTIQDLAEEYSIEPEKFAMMARKDNIEELDPEKFRRYIVRTENLFMEAFLYDEKILAGGNFVPRTQRHLFPKIHTSTGDKKEEGEDNIVYFDSESNTLNLAQNGQTYKFEEISLKEGFVDKVNLRLKQLEELHQNAIAQKGTQIEKTKGNLFQKIRDWLSMKNREQEAKQEIGDNQRENI